MCVQAVLGSYGPGTDCSCETGQDCGSSSKALEISNFTYLLTVSKIKKVKYKEQHLIICILLVNLPTYRTRALNVFHCWIFGIMSGTRKSHVYLNRHDQGTKCCSVLFGLFFDNPSICFSTSLKTGEVCGTHYSQINLGLYIICCGTAPNALLLLGSALNVLDSPGISRKFR